MLQCCSLSMHCVAVWCNTRYTWWCRSCSPCQRRIGGSEQTLKVVGNLKECVSREICFVVWCPWHLSQDTLIQTLLFTPQHCITRPQTLPHNSRKILSFTFCTRCASVRSGVLNICPQWSWATLTLHLAPFHNCAKWSSKNCAKHGFWAASAAKF